MMTRLTTLALLGVFAGSVAAYEAPAFTDVDADLDGVITPDEAAIVENLDFEAADTNADGVLDQVEYDVAVGKVQGTQG